MFILSAGKIILKYLPAVTFAGLLFFSPAKGTAQLENNGVSELATLEKRKSGEVTSSNPELDKTTSELREVEAELLKLLNAGPESGNRVIPSQAEMPKETDSPPNAAPALETAQEQLADDETIEVIKAKADLEKISKSASKARNLNTQQVLENPVNSQVADTKLGNDKALEDLQRAEAQLQRDLRETKEKLNAARLELSNARNRLMLAETENERLSNLIAQRNISNLSSYMPKSKPAQKAPSENTNSNQAKYLKSLDQSISADMLIATVVVDKANLRSGPGAENSPLMTVSKGTRLAVETREGSWYRVISPNGSRAWVASEVLRFGRNNKTPPNDIFRIKGFDPDFGKASDVPN